MNDINYVAVAVAAVAVFIVSTAWYMMFSTQRAALLGAKASAAGEKPPPWKIVGELVRSAVVGLVIAGLAAKLSADGIGETVLLGVVLWVGFPFILLTGSVIWDNVSWKLAAIHAGDWLLKLVVIAAIVGAWQ
ncbi:MAG TPA: DUF1761 domain-containing protein [Mycobacteriales bacterium]|jgi:hypothetical protein|nr:DUF1761 domain-containing protein [Mycobacteriales bacterium]